MEKNNGPRNLAIVGIKTGGDFLALCIKNEIEKIENQKIELGYLDINLYRDDIANLHKIPIIKETYIAFSPDHKNIIFIDDVIYTGRTIRAAMDAIMDLGRPDRIQLACLIDRGHRELPIKADYIGKTITTTREQKIIVYFTKEEKNKRVVII